MQLADIRRTAHEHEASDIHLISGHPPMIRVNTVMTPLDYPLLTPESVETYLSMRGTPDPDLVIRTGGEQRVSNFLLWQLAYAELYFTPVLWPDFDLAQFDLALASYVSRQRRFGLTGEQAEAARRA